MTNKYPNIRFLRLEQEDLNRIRQKKTTELVKDIIGSTYELQFQASVYDCQYLQALYDELEYRLDNDLLDNKLRAIILQRGIPRTKNLREALEEVSGWEVE